MKKEKQMSPATDDSKPVQHSYVENEGIRYRIPAEIPNYSDGRQKSWAEVYLPGQSVEVQEEHQKLFEELVNRVRYQDPIYEDGLKNLEWKQYFDGTVWEIRNKLYEMDHYGVRHFQTRIVYGYINSEVPVYGIQYLLEHNFELEDESVHTFDVWMNADSLKIKPNRAGSIMDPEFYAGINYIDEDGEFCIDEESDFGNDD